MNTIDYAAITARQQATWATGDLHELARQMLPVSESRMLWSRFRRAAR